MSAPTVFFQHPQDSPANPLLHALFLCLFLNFSYGLRISYTRVTSFDQIYFPFPPLATPHFPFPTEFT